MNALLVFSVIQHHIKTPRHGDDELMQIFVRMTTTFRTTWNIVEIINAPDIKRDMAIALNEREITSRVGNLWQVNHSTLGYLHNQSIQFNRAV